MSGYFKIKDFLLDIFSLSQWDSSIWSLRTILVFQNKSFQKAAETLMLPETIGYLKLQQQPELLKRRMMCYVKSNLLLFL